MATPTSSRRFELCARAIAALLAGSAPACVDSSIPSDASSNPPPGELLVAPDAWSTRPAKVQVFEGSDPEDPSAQLAWAPPAAAKVLWIQGNRIALVSTGVLGDSELVAHSLAAPQKQGAAQIRIVDFGFATKLQLGYDGSAAMHPQGDVAVAQELDADVPGQVFVAYLNGATGENVVRVYTPDFATLVDEVPGRGFSHLQPPHIAADGAGNAYWVEQFYAAQDGQRVRQITRLKPDGTLNVFKLDATQFGGLDVAVGTDIAAAVDGALYLCARGAGSVLLCAFEGLFDGGTPAAHVLGALQVSPSEARLAVDSEGRLLVAQSHLLSRWTPDPDGLGAAIEPLPSLPEPAVDLDADAGGTIYAGLATRVWILDVFGTPTAELALLELEGGLVAEVEQLLGLGCDAQGNLRLLDDPRADDPALGIFAARAYAVDLGGL